MEDVPAILMSGLPGKMATLVAERILKDNKYPLLSVGLTGENQPEKISIGGEHHNFSLSSPEKHGGQLKDLKMIGGDPIIIDFSQPDAVNRNAELYCERRVPFVMGTTGGDRRALENAVRDSGNTAVIAPNMADPIVLVQAMFDYVANTFPGALEGYRLDAAESHQATKKDTSGTAKAMVGSFKDLGAFLEGDIQKVRESADQLGMGIPEQYLDGHGWHTYTLTSPDGTVALKFTHNVNGRQPYVNGTIKAIDFLVGKLKTGEAGCYNMIDVLRGGKVDSRVSE